MRCFHLKAAYDEPWAISGPCDDLFFFPALQRMTCAQSSLGRIIGKKGSMLAQIETSTGACILHVQVGVAFNETARTCQAVPLILRVWSLHRRSNRAARARPRLATLTLRSPYCRLSSLHRRRDARGRRGKAQARSEIRSALVVSEFQRRRHSTAECRRS